AMTTTVRASVLRSLILDTIIAQEAAAQGLAATDAQVQSEVDTEAAQAGGMSQLQSELAGAGGSIAQLRDEIRSQMNEQRLEDHFARGRAATVEQALAGGEAFAQAAMQYSDDTGTNGKGCDPCVRQGRRRRSVLWCPKPVAGAGICVPCRRMRCFLAVPLREPALGAAQRTLANLREKVDAVRWTRPETLHITVHFFGNVDDAEFARAVAAA